MVRLRLDLDIRLILIGVSGWVFGSLVVCVWFEVCLFLFLG